MVKYEKALWPEQIRRRTGKTIFVSKIGMQFYPDITKGFSRKIAGIQQQANGEVVLFKDGGKLLMSELGTIWVAFDKRPTSNNQRCWYGDTLHDLRYTVSAGYHFETAHLD